MDDQTNYLGATIFWLYILAALTFTAIILFRLLPNIEPSRHIPKDVAGQNTRRIWLFTSLAGLSFAILSWNMMNVLIQSFTLWARVRNLSLADASLSLIWEWSVTSTLFRDFGNAIVQSSARYLWVEADLLATLCVCLFIGIEGQQTYVLAFRVMAIVLTSHIGRHRKIPKLWAFICLGQILPISFTQNLFYIALLRQSQHSSEWRISRGSVVLLSGVYCACLIVAPAAAGTEWLIPLILLARLLLVAVQTMDWIRSDAGQTRVDSTSEARFTRDDLASHLSLLATLCGFAQASLALLEEAPANIGRALFSHPAVSSLGCDFLLSAISYLCWRHFGQTTASSSKDTAN